MNHDEIKRIAASYLNKRALESDCLEYKASELQRDAILKTLCAFANNYMNRSLCLILLGVEEEKDPKKKGTPVVPILGFDEGVIETVENSVRSLIPFIKPKIEMDITHFDYGGRACVAIALSKNDKGPYAVVERAKSDKNILLPAGRYIRLERDSRLATFREEYELLKKFADYHFSEMPSKTATVDDLDIDLLREYIRLTSPKDNTIRLDKESICRQMSLLDESDPNHEIAKNYAVLMFSRNPERFIPYAYVELIRYTGKGESVMASLDFKGPIWKVDKAIMEYLDSSFLRSFTIRPDNISEHRVVWNYPRAALEELITNAIVHKDYETPRTVQIYLYKERVVISNYNKPIPPITARSLNSDSAFPNRGYENPRLREMFKDLGLIESWGTGIGKAKRSLLDNGSPELHFEEFPEDVDITSVSIPINKEYLALEGELYIGDEKMNIGAENMNINVQIKSIKGRIEALSASPRQKEALLKLVEPLFGKVFGRREVLMILGCAVATGTKYVAILENGGVIEPVQGLGKGKYRFAVK